MAKNEDDYKPILVQFESGPLSNKLRSNVNFKLLRSTKTNKRMLRAGVGDLFYDGYVSQKQLNHVKYYIGVIDEKPSTIEDVQEAQLCTLKPKVNEKATATMTSDMTFRQKGDLLIAAFGSSKQKRSVSSRKTNENAHESIEKKVAGAAKKVLLDPSRPSWTPSPEQEANSEIIPPMNMDARSPAEIYKIGDIIPLHDYSMLKQYAKEMTFFEDATLISWRAENKYPLHIIRVLSQISPLPKNSTERIRKGAYICYLNYLIQFDKVAPKDLKNPNRDPCPNVPDLFKKSIFEKYTLPASTNAKSRCRPAKLKDKLYCYIFVLALTIENYDMDCNLLVKDLKIGIAKVNKLLRATGCTVTTRNPVKTEDCLPSDQIIRAVLKAPNENERNTTPKGLNSQIATNNAMKVKKDI